MSTKRKKVSSRESTERQVYFIRIQSVETEYSFGLPFSLDEDKLFSEINTIMISGHLLRPEIRGVYHAELLLYGERDIDLRLQEVQFNYAKEVRPNMIGRMDVRNGTLRGGINIPFAGLAFIQPALLANRIEVVVLRGRKLKYQFARITDIDFAAHYRPEES